jgi:hypothetical protein
MNELGRVTLLIIGWGIEQCTLNTHYKKMIT